MNEFCENCTSIKNGCTKKPILMCVGGHEAEGDGWVTDEYGSIIKIYKCPVAEIKYFAQIEEYKVSITEDFTFDRTQTVFEQVEIIFARFKRTNDSIFQLNNLKTKKRKSIKIKSIDDVEEYIKWCIKA